MKKIIFDKIEQSVAIIAAIAICSGCKTTQIVTEYQEIEVHDTVEVELNTIVTQYRAVHDTIIEQKELLVRDSTVIYLDEFGNVLNREHYRESEVNAYKAAILSVTAQYDSLKSCYEREIQRQRELLQRESETVVEHRSLWTEIWQSLLSSLGGLVLGICIILFTRRLS